MPSFRLKVYPRRLLPLYQRDWLGTDAIFRLKQKEILKMIQIVQKTILIMLRNGRLNTRLRIRLYSILGALRKRYLVNMIVEVPERNPTIVYERQTFRRFINEFCNPGDGYLSIPCSDRLRFRSEEDLHRYIVYMLRIS